LIASYFYHIVDDVLIDILFVVLVIDC